MSPVLNTVKWALNRFGGLVNTASTTAPRWSRAIAITRCDNGEDAG